MVICGIVGSELCWNARLLLDFSVMCGVAGCSNADEMLAHMEVNETFGKVLLSLKFWEEQNAILLFCGNWDQTSIFGLVGPKLRKSV